MNNRFRRLLLIPWLALSGFFLAMPSFLHAADQQVAVTSGPPSSQYKVISGFKQPFKDSLRFETSNGWTPVGGVSVTTWNNDLYFAQLLSKAAAQQ